MRNMSFSMTTQQVRDKTKTVTRRLGWADLRPGDQVCAVVKAMGLKRGEKVEKICVIQCVSNGRELVKDIYNEYTQRELVAEGFPDMTPEEFVEMFCEHNDCEPHTTINRIEFKYV